MTKIKENKELHKQLMEKSCCAFCGKKGCHNECRTEWDKTLLHLQCEGYNLEELDYQLRKTSDALYEAIETLDKQTEENQIILAAHKKQKPKPAKKAG